MIHSICCNARDCPWHRRGNKCRHPDCVNPVIAQRSYDTVPLLCPVRKEPQVIVVGGDVVSCRKQIRKVIDDVEFWKDVIELGNLKTLKERQKKAKAIAKRSLKMRIGG